MKEDRHARLCGREPCFCRGCGYNLRDITGRCPECSRCFDRNDRRTFSRGSSAQGRVFAIWWLRIIVIGSLLPALGLIWLSYGRYRDQRSAALIESRDCFSTKTGFSLGVVASVEPISPWFLTVLPKKWGFLALRSTDVRLDGGVWDDGDLANLSGMSYLHSLSLHNTAISDSGLEMLATLPQIEYLRIDRSKITDQGLSHLAALSNLKAIKIIDSPIEGSGLEALKSLGQLRVLWLKATLIDDSGMSHLNLESLEELRLSGAMFSDRGLQNLGRMTRLRVLDLDSTGITGAGIRYLRSLSRLRALDLSGTRVGDDGVEDLVVLQSLEDLDVQETTISAAGIRKLKSGLPNARISF